MEDLAEFVTPIRAASERPLVVAIGAPLGIPYRITAQVQRELVAAGALRVLFREVEPDGSSTTPGGGGSAIVLPASYMQVPVSGLNLLHLIVQPDGVVHVRRGMAAGSQEMDIGEIEALWRRGHEDNANLIAAVKVHPEAAHELMVAVLDALHAADAQRISIQELVM